MVKFEEGVTGVASADDALAIYDRLEPIPAEFMLGWWRGSEFPSGHPMDGLLAASGWYGKRFESAEAVHPLLFYGLRRAHVFSIDPARVPLDIPLRAFEAMKGRNLHGLIACAKPLLSTKRPGARLRMTEYRGKLSATMIYDAKPIHDVFRKADDQTVLGAMDYRGFERPYFFVLRRDAHPPAS